MRKTKRLTCEWCAGPLGEGRIGKRFCKPACCVASWRSRHGLTKAPRSYGVPYRTRQASRPQHDRTGELEEGIAAPLACCGFNWGEDPTTTALWVYLAIAGAVALLIGIIAVRVWRRKP